MLVLLVCTVAACGKKGSPQTPFVYVPAEVGGVTARRMGDQVYVTMTVPAQNIDTSKPAAISRIDVYAATSLTAPPRARFLEIARLVATIPIAPVPAPGQPPPAPGAAGAEGAAQGATVSIRETLTDQDLQPRELPTLGGAADTALAPVTPGSQYLRRFYQAIPYDLRGRPGPPGPVIELPLPPLPEPPTALRVTHTATNVTVQWEPSGGVLAWLLDNVVQPPERPPLDDLPAPAPTAALSPAATPAGPTTYLVYREQAADPVQLPPSAASVWSLAAPTPVTAAPSPALTFSQPIELNERTVCYSVRAVRGAAISAPSEPACITPTDIYPPAAPANVNLAPAEGQITVFWDPSGEPDLGGYIVLRRTDPAARPVPLMLTPILESRYVDRDVKAGVQYFYTVVAVDQRLPLPNLSLPSAEQSDTAR